jgi:O-antigen ligase
MLVSRPNFEWQKILKFTELLGLVITLALLPIDRFPYTHKIPLRLGLISILLLAAATVVRLFLVWRQKRFDNLKRYLIVGVLLCLPVIGYTLSSIYAIDRSFALGATTLLAAVAARAYFFYIILSESPTYWNFIRKTLYVVSALVVAFGLFQFFFDVWGAPTSLTDLRNCCTSNSTYVFPRVHSTGLEPLYFDHYLMIPLWLLTFDFWKNKKTRKNKLYIALFIATAALFVLTIARSAIIGLTLAAIVFYMGARGQKDFNSSLRFLAKLWGTVLFISVVLIIMSGIAAIFIDKTAQYNSKGANSLGLFSGHLVDVNDGSAQTRYKLWPKAIDYFKEQPLHGVGADNSRIRIDLKDYRRGVAPTRLQPFNNDLIGLIVDLGLLSVLTFGPLIVVLIRGVYTLYKKAWKPLASPFAVILIGMAVQGNFFQSILLTRTWVVIGILMTTILPAQSKVRPADENRN